MKPKKIKAQQTAELYQRPTYTGDNFDPDAQRPGCLDFLKYPSRIGAKLCEYKPPICNSSSVKIK